MRDAITQKIKNAETMDLVTLLIAMSVTAFVFFVGAAVFVYQMVKLFVGC